ncbi:MAG: hypothetical protein WDZ48_08170 [Pirellulales bacterium]
MSSSAEGTSWMNNPERYLIWFLSAALATAAVAWIAFQIQQNGVAPAILFPLLVGVVLGAALATIGRIVRVPPRRAAAILALCWGLLAALAQDYIGHRVRLRHYDDELGRNPLAAAMSREGQLRPTFADHLAGKLQADPVWWTLDLVLTAAAAGLDVRVISLSPRGRGQSKTLSPRGRGQGEGD